MSELIAGVDEVGRGPLAGPVYAAAVIFAASEPFLNIKDSKQLTAKQRENWAEIIQKEALAWSLGWAEVEEIDQLNILQATFLAMQRAVAGLSIIPQRVLIDGHQLPQLPYPAQAIIGGDRSVPVISAASILAKVTRDAEMERLDRVYPGYGFNRHKGYGTAMHLQALSALGPCPIHRRSFGPVRKLIEVSR